MMKPFILRYENKLIAQINVHRNQLRFKCKRILKILNNFFLINNSFTNRVAIVCTLGKFYLRRTLVHFYVIE